MTRSTISSHQFSIQGLVTLAVAIGLSALMATPSRAVMVTFVQGGSYTVPDNDIRLVGTNGDGIAEGNPRWNAGIWDATETDREVVKFDITSIPSVATVNSVKLDVFWRTDGGFTNLAQLELHRVTTNFSENDATWNKASVASGTPWGTPGGDFQATVLSSLAAAATPTDHQQFTFTSNANFVAAANASLVGTGDGFLRLLMKGTDETLGVRHGGSFDAENDGANTSYLPVLTINYSVPEPASLGVIALGAIAMIRRRK